MNKVLHISAAALLIFAVACNPFTVDNRYDITNVDKTVTVFPGATVSFEQEVLDMHIGELLGEATGPDSFLKIAEANHPLFEEGDLYFRQDGSAKNISPNREDLFNGSGEATFKNALAVYMVDVPGMLNVSNQYNLSNPCIALQIGTDWVQPMKMDVKLLVGGVPLTLTDVPLSAAASQTVYISETGGFSGAANTSDAILSGFAAAVSPLPYNITVSEVALKGQGSPSYTPGTPLNLTLTASFILPAAFKAPSSFGSALAFSGVKITPSSEKYKLGIDAISAHFVAVNTAPVQISIVGQPNDSVSISFPTIAPGTLAEPATTEGDVTLTYMSYTAISSLVTDIQGTITSANAQLNDKQGIKLTIKSVTLPDGVEIEFLEDKKEEE